MMILRPRRLFRMRMSCDLFPFFLVITTGVAQFSFAAYLLCVATVPYYPHLADTPAASAASATPAASPSSSSSSSSPSEPLASSWISDDIPWPLRVRATWCVFLFLICTMYYSYLMAAWTDPGTLAAPEADLVPSVNQQSSASGYEFEYDSDAPEQEQQPFDDGAYRNFCTKCELGVPRPERAHHCWDCGTCVLRMDHHCVWIDNCVGFYNYKYFFLFVVYCALAACWYCVLLAQFLLLLSSSMSPSPSPSSSSPSSSNGNPRFPLGIFGLLLVVIDGIFCVCLALGMLIFSGWHAYYVLTNQTAIEHSINQRLSRIAAARGKSRFVSKYNYGFLRNMREMLGAHSNGHAFHGKQTLLDFLCYLLPFNLPKYGSHPVRYPSAPLWDPTLSTAAIA
eukprot:ANDGO_07940.mRNA.1 putative protein S-acyltransferase 16